MRLGHVVQILNVVVCLDYGIIMQIVQVNIVLVKMMFLMEHVIIIVMKNGVQPLLILQLVEVLGIIVYHLERQFQMNPPGNVGGNVTVKEWMILGLYVVDTVTVLH